MTNKDQAICLLLAARYLITDKENWTVRLFARDIYNSGVTPTSFEACKWCAAGAIIAVTPPNLVWSVNSYVNDAMKRGSEGWGVTWINDTKGHTATLKMFDDAIEYLEMIE